MSKTKPRLRFTMTNIEADKDITEILEKLILDINSIKTSIGGQHYQQSWHFTIEAAKQALYQRLASEAVDYEKWIGENQATGHAIKVKAIPLDKLAELMGVEK
jgi:hypothetical protein